MCNDLFGTLYSHKWFCAGFGKDFILRNFLILICWSNMVQLYPDVEVFETYFRKIIALLQALAVPD